MEQIIAPAGLRLPAAALYVGVSPATLKRLVRQGKITPARLGRTRVYSRSALDLMLEQATA